MDVSLAKTRSSKEMEHNTPLWTEEHLEEMLDAAIDPEVQVGFIFDFMFISEWSGSAYVWYLKKSFICLTSKFLSFSFTS